EQTSRLPPASWLSQGSAQGSEGDSTPGATPHELLAQARARWCRGDAAGAMAAAELAVAGARALQPAAAMAPLLALAESQLAVGQFADAEASAGEALSLAIELARLGGGSSSSSARSIHGSSSDANNHNNSSNSASESHVKSRSDKSASNVSDSSNSISRGGIAEAAARLVLARALLAKEGPEEARE
ncbi:unnamed protein product, partial [Polarella glacialis]